MVAGEIESRIRSLLIIAHTPSDNTRSLASAVIEGARDPSVTGVETRLRSPFEAGADDVRAANAIILGTPENFGYMSGALKDFFDRIYYPCLDHSAALPYALFIRAGQDGSGACRSIERIVTGLKWKAVQAPLICKGDCADFIEPCRELGLFMAAGLEAGIL